MNEAWDDFWAGEQSGGGGCLPARWQPIDTAQRKVWQAFARTLRKGAKVLDLGTGDGRLMGWLVGARPDLKPFGIDLAERIPKPPRGTRSRGGVAMEALPFPDQSQDAVVGQFSVEYGDVPRVLAEIVRVLKPGSPICLMTHRLDGPILEYNRPRREGLKWALEGADLIGVARAGLALRDLGVAIPPAIAAAPAEAVARFGAGSAPWELAEAIRQTFALGRYDNAGELLKVLATLESKARNEIGRIDSLEQACNRVADKDRVRGWFAEAGLMLESSGPVTEQGSGRAFADLWHLRREG